MKFTKALIGFFLMTICFAFTAQASPGTGYNPGEWVQPAAVVFTVETTDGYSIPDINLSLDQPSQDGFINTLISDANDKSLQTVYQDRFKPIGENLKVSRMAHSYRQFYSDH